MRYINAKVILFVSLALSGCADSHQLIRYGRTAESSRRLVSRDSIYIAIPQDGVYASRPYKGSGLSTSRILFASFAKHARRVDMARSYQNLEDALQFTRDNGYKYLVYPTILHWEDRATEWSGLPDRVEVKIDIVESATSDLFESVIIRGKSGLATLGGDHPQDLLPGPIEEFVLTLF